MATKCEQLIRRVGEMDQCDICLKMKIFDRRWMMTENKKIVCPECQDTVARRGGLLVSI